MSSRPSFPVSTLDYELPPELIAQSPPPRREDARLMIVDRATGSIDDRRISDLADQFRSGDLLIVNDTKVLPAKFALHRTTGGRIEGLFLEESAPGVWLVVLDGVRRLRPDESLSTKGRSGRTVSLTLLERLDEGRCKVGITPPDSAEAVLDDIGVTPLPPYIRRMYDDAGSDPTDRDRYQTVYARNPGAVAAPTAGFHLTLVLLEALKQRGVERASVTLHVGLGTFKPITVEDLADHPMHAERYQLPPETADAVRRCKTSGGRIIAVGTTSVRVLESSASPVSAFCVSVFSEPSVPVDTGSGTTDLLLYPPCEFRVVDTLLTNFHLPRSTLLALVMAFAGIDLTRRAYAHAISQGYRFYSFGDAMLIV